MAPGSDGEEKTQQRHNRDLNPMHPITTSSPIDVIFHVFAERRNRPLLSACTVETPPSSAEEKGIFRRGSYARHCRHVRSFVTVKKLENHVFVTAGEAGFRSSAKTLYKEG